MTPSPLSWGRFPRIQSATQRLHWPDDPWPGTGPLLAYGLGRSYGDVCLVEQGTLLLTRGWNRFLSFDQERGLLTCESGVSFDEILQLVVPRGWFLPVTPGTRFVTVGGAIANDVHGKNHHVAGTFGNYVLWLDLRRSDGTTVRCSGTAAAGMFAATIGGLGLTGVIVRAAIQLVRIPSPWICQEAIAFSGLDEFAAVSTASEGWPYTVAWIDCFRSRADTPGIFFRGDFTDGPAIRWGKPRLQVPIEAPGWLLNRATMGGFNRAYRWIQERHQAATRTSFLPFFYPLDAVGHWNRIYGRQGFLQWQCLIPHRDSTAALSELLTVIRRAGAGSFLAVLKVFGEARSPGMLSFPTEGITLALDFPIHGAETFSLLDRLDRTVAAAGGRLYPAKDARMSSEMFQLSHPRLHEFLEYKDPAFSSALWTRVGQSG